MNPAFRFIFNLIVNRHWDIFSDFYSKTDFHILATLTYSKNLWIKSDPYQLLLLKYMYKNCTVLWTVWLLYISLPAPASQTLSWVTDLWGIIYTKEHPFSYLTYHLPSIFFAFVSIRFLSLLSWLFFEVCVIPYSFSTISLLWCCVAFHMQLGLCWPFSLKKKT